MCVATFYEKIESIFTHVVTSFTKYSYKYYIIENPVITVGNDILFT